MTMRMLVDATHAEETRVVVADGNRLVEFDFETSTKKQFKGNIYLAKVVRVEPSLQAAFVDYGGSRHGFLSFNEIHPDYYRIPVADRRVLLDQARREVEDEGEEDEAKRSSDSVEVIGGDETEDIARAGEAVRRRIRSNARQYKIQEVIKRRQILLVQVVKEERGTKGAALTTYLSLPGRYCVLMPNTARGGGISRKITGLQQRKRLKGILGELNVLEGMGVILRTAGVERSKAEIKRDYDYLKRNWDEIRELTLKSTAPSLINEEANIITRSLRDVYSRDIEEVLVEGDEAYKTAKAFMRTMLPSHARRVQQYDGSEVPLFHRYQIESQLDEIHSPVVQLPSGGSIVISPTEALVSIDVNSGRATRERNIEETALQTNKEAAGEIARQLRLRDLAGLIVIDFIDMEDRRNNAVVERILKEAMRSGRARVQIGRISPFGLLEMSRQRLRPSLVEAHTRTCPTCSGTGLVRSTESAALRVLRAIEEEGVRRRTGEMHVYVPAHVALYILNQKRAALTTIEARHALKVSIGADDTLVTPDFRMERTRGLGGEEVEVEQVTRAARETEAELAGDDGKNRRRRRRPRRRDEPVRDEVPLAVVEDATAAEEEEPAKLAAEAGDTTTASPTETKRRRRGRRGGRRRGRRTQAEIVPADAEMAVSPTPQAESAPQAMPEPAVADEAAAQEPAAQPRRRRARGHRTNGAAGRREAEATPVAAAPDAAAEDGEAEKPRRRQRTRRPRTAAKAGRSVAAPAPQNSDDNVTQFPAPAGHDPAKVPAGSAAGQAAIASEIGASASIIAKSPRKTPVAVDYSGDAPAAASKDDDNQPARKGWWNRILS